MMQVNTSVVLCIEWHKSEAGKLKGTTDMQVKNFEINSET